MFINKEFKCFSYTLKIHLFIYGAVYLYINATTLTVYIFLVCVFLDDVKWNFQFYVNNVILKHNFNNIEKYCEYIGRFRLDKRG